MELVKVAYLDAGGCAQHDAAEVARNIARESGSEVTWIGFDEGALHGSIARRLLHLGRANILVAGRVSAIGSYDIVVAPAVTDASSGYIERDLSAAILTKFGPIPILLVRRQLFRVNRVLLLIDSTPACRTLARRLVQLGLWGEAQSRFWRWTGPPLRCFYKMMSKCFAPVVAGP
jgi:hypothetical protein